MRTLVISVGMVIFMTSCGQPDRVKITDTLERSVYRPADKPNATSDERFALAAPRPMSGAGRMQNAQAAGGTPPFHYEVPEGWAEVASTQFRNINFTLGPNNEIECYVSILPGGGGGLAVNVNRWRHQFGQEDYSAEELKALPKAPIMGVDAAMVNFTGTFTTMRGDVKEDYHLLGAILELPNKLVTIKMVGPSDLVKNELQNFALFVNSLHDGSGHAHADQSAAAPAPAPTKPVTSAHGFRWAIPEGWAFVQHPSSMRLVTFAVGENRDTECYVVVLGGTGGGRLSNFNRWLNQLGADPLDESELELQPQLEILGKQAPMLIAQGTYTGMGNANMADAMLLGTSVEAGGRSLFIKMVGPVSTVQGQWDAFKQFCASLEQE